MGRPPKPTAAHKAVGSFRADRHDGAEPPAIGMLEKPSMNDKAGWCWDQIAEQLKANGAAAADVPLVLRLCNWWATAETCQERIDSGDWEYRDLCMLSMASKHIEKLASMLGLSPVDRARLRVKTPEKAGPKLADFKLA
jgi:phage terminase small subunit